MSFNFEIPMRIVELYQSVLIHAAASSTDPQVPDDENQRIVAAILGIIDKLVAKHLSDSPDKSDKKKLAIEVFETALKIAKGELKI